MKLTENQIADELRAMRPLPEPAFAAALDETAGMRHRDPIAPVARFFKRLMAIPPRRALPIGAAVVMAATVVAVGVVSLSEKNEPDSLTSIVPEAGTATNATTDELQVAPESGAAIGSAVPSRDVAQTASMTLSTANDEVADVAAGVSDVTDRYHGFVVSSSVHTSDKGNSGGTLELRIPTAKLQPALADLSDLAHVSARDDGAVDITAKTDSSRDQIAALEKQLAADPSNQAVRDALAAQRDLLRRLEARVQFTPVSVTIKGDRSDDSGWTIGDAADDAGSVLKAIAGGTLVTLAVLVPLALLCALIWLATRGYRRRARERALD
jgi:hypothetical protein